MLDTCDQTPELYLEAKKHCALWFVAAMHENPTTSPPRKIADPPNVPPIHTASTFTTEDFWVLASDQNDIPAANPTNDAMTIPTRNLARFMLKGYAQKPCQIKLEHYLATVDGAIAAAANVESIAQNARRSYVHAIISPGRSFSWIENHVSWAPRLDDRVSIARMLLA
jgi:hypothetical protein